MIITSNVIGESFAELSMEEMQFVAGAVNPGTDTTPISAIVVSIETTIEISAIVSGAAHCF